MHWPRVEKEELWHWIPSAECENVQVVLPAGLVTTWHGLATHVTGLACVHTPAAQVACADVPEPVVVRVQLLPSIAFE